MEKKRQHSRQAGFTLIEIIAVLVILGILAAVAVPKFVNLQKEARIKAAQGLVASAQSALSMKYSEALLQNNGDVNATWNTLTTAPNPQSICDNNVQRDGYNGYTLTCSANNNVINIVVTTPDNEDVNGTFTNPGQ